MTVSDFREGCSRATRDDLAVKKGWKFSGKVILFWKPQNGQLG